MVKKLPILLSLVALSMTLSACNRDPHAAENAGRQIDQAAAEGEQKMNQAATDAKVEAKNETAKAAAQIDDATVTAKVKSALIAEPGLKALEIRVETNAGVVTLTGNVATPELMSRATQVAQGVEGVKSVNNSLVVKASS